MKNKKNKHKDLVLYEVKRGNIEKMFQFLQQVANYNVDIALAVKGAKQLKDVRRNVTQLSKEISTLNKLSNKQSKTLSSRR